MTTTDWRLLLWIVTVMLMGFALGFMARGDLHTALGICQAAPREAPSASGLAPWVAECRALGGIPQKLEGQRVCESGESYSKNARARLEWALFGDPD